MATSPILFVFPGQGSQYPGIGRDLFDAFESVRQLYGQASEVLGYDLAALPFEDSEGKINLTRYTQPVLLTHSISCLQAFQEITNGKVRPGVTAGHSLGEYSALVAAGALDFPCALQLVKTRGQLMGDLGDGEMEALPLPIENAQELAEQHYCAVAACNLPEQTVVGGRVEDLDALVTDFQERYPGKRSARLKTEGAFHTFYMIEAALRFRKALSGAPFSSPAIEVLSNSSGIFHRKDSNSIRAGLFSQLFNPVQWHANLMHAATQGCDTIIEFGGGIGKGETAAEKKPNLASIIKKSFRRQPNPPRYLSVINQETLSEAASVFRL